METSGATATAEDTSPPPPPSPAEEEEGDVCRICRNPGEEGDPLRYPCACKGSIRYVHEDCLLQWLNHSNNRNCEVCKYPFSFTPVYAENAPSRLPFQEFVVGIASKAYRVLRFVLRLSLVLSVWLFIIPYTTFWIMRWSFVRSFSEAYGLFFSHKFTTVLTDCLYGFILSSSIVLIFLGATSLRDYFRQLREIRGQVGNREDDGDIDGGVAQEVDGAENIAARLEMRAARIEAQFAQIVNGLDDADGAEDISFAEIVGMQGPMFHLLENAFTVLASNMIFLGLVILMPFTIGRVILYYVTVNLTSATDPVILAQNPGAEYRSPLANISVLKNALTAAANLTSDNRETNLLGQISETLRANLTLSIPDDTIKGGTIETSYLSDVATLAVGYMFIISLVFLYFGLIALIRLARGEPLAMGRFYGMTSIRGTIVSLFRHFAAAMRHLMTIIKVSFLLAIELGGFPLTCGWLVDMSTMRMFGKSMNERVEYFYDSPVNSILLHWGMGLVFMLQMNIFVTLLRGVLRNGVLYFFRDPADPNYNPFRDLIDDPVHKHARKVLFSFAIYGSVILLLVLFPVELAMRVAPSFFPLDMSVSDPYTEIPADMLLFRICVPFAIEHFKLHTTIKALLRYWFTAVARILGLTYFLLPRREELQNWPHVQLGEQDGTVATDDPNQGSGFRFFLRIVLLLLVSWMALLIVITALIVVPISLGRGLFNTIPNLPIIDGIKSNDMYAFVVGIFIIWAASSGVRYSIENIQAHRGSVLLGRIWKWGGIVFKSSALLSIWIFVIPVLIGLLFELLIIVPMRVPVNESPVFLLYQDWALGLIFLKIWTRVVMLDHVVPMVDESWQIKMRRVREDGFSGLRGFWVLREIVLPITMKLLTALCVPYVLARGVFPVFGYPLLVNSAVYRFAWLGCLALILVGFCAKRFHVLLTNLHNSIRDDRYLIGRRLHNFGEDVEVKERVEGISSGSQSLNLQATDTIQNVHEADIGLRLRHANRQDA